MSPLLRPFWIALAAASLAFGPGVSAMTPAETSAAAPAPVKGETAAADSKPDAQGRFIYKLTSADRLRVVLYGEPDLATVTRIDARGNINLFLVGDVHVAGSTVNEAQKIIEVAYHDGRFLRNPEATISVEDYAPRTVTVDGQVKSPGPIPLPVESTLTVYQAIIRSGGFRRRQRLCRAGDTHRTRRLEKGFHRRCGQPDQREGSDEGKGRFSSAGAR